MICLVAGMIWIKGVGFPDNFKRTVDVIYSSTYYNYVKITEPRTTTKKYHIEINDEYQKVAKTSCGNK